MALVLFVYGLLGLVEVKKLAPHSSTKHVQT